MKIIGEYISGQFIMRYYGVNIEYETGLFMPFDIGDSKDSFTYSSLDKEDDELYGEGFYKTQRIETLLHECNHYIQDLSIPACIVNDYIKDEMSYYLKLLVDGFNHLRFPLMDKDNVAYNRSLLPDYYQKVYDSLFDHEHLNYFYFIKKHTSFLEYKELNHLFSDKEELSYTDLLEGHAHYKTILDLIGRATLSGKCEYLHKYKNAKNLIPYSLNEDYIDFTKVLEGNLRAYHIARFLYMKTLRFDLKEAFSYLKNDWPKDYYETNLAIHDTGFLMCLDIALSIPPLHYIIKVVNDGLYKIEDFSPVHRYKIILDIVDKNGGYPEAIEGEKFYVTFFNFISTKGHVKWPDYFETLESWQWYFSSKIEKGHDTSDGYRARSFFHKLLNPNRYYVNSPITICGESVIPILYVVRGGSLKIINIYGNRFVPFEGVFTVYQLFNYPFHPWEPNDDMEMSEQLRKEQMNQHSLMREVIYRSISRDIQCFLAKSKQFSCSVYNDDFYNYLNKHGENKQFNPELPPVICCSSMDKVKCCNIENLNNLPKINCAVRDYLQLYNYKIENINP